MKRLILCLLPLSILAGCASQPPAPVADRTPPVMPTKTPPPTPVAVGGPGFYTVKKGDTLYRIALDHGVYYRDMAAWNNITDVNNIKEGQVLRVTPPAPGDGPVVQSQPVVTGAPVEVRPLGAPPTVAPVASDTLKREPRVNKEPYSDAAWERAQKPTEAPTRLAEAKPVEAKPADKAVPAEIKPGPAADAASGEWAWPVTAPKVIAGFGEGGNKGIDIAGKDGDAITAAADGKVFFVGLQKGYGNLLIIGHSNGYISVYAHNRKILVSEKQQVTKGQKVAEMGRSDSENGVKLHFEIRQQGKPVDPLTFLPKR